MSVISQVFHTIRINLSPFTKDFRVWETLIESYPISLWVFLVKTSLSLDVQVLSLLCDSMLQFHPYIRTTESQNLSMGKLWNQTYVCPKTFWDNSTLAQFWNECLKFFSYPYLTKDEQAFSSHFGTTQKDVLKQCSLLREVVKILEVNVLLRLSINQDISTLGILTWHGG